MPTIPTGDPLQLLEAAAAPEALVILWPLRGCYGSLHFHQSYFKQPEWDNCRYTLLRQYKPTQSQRSAPVCRFLPPKEENQDGEGNAERFETAAPEEKAEVTYGLTVFGKRKAEGSAGAAEADEGEGTANGTTETGQQVIDNLTFLALCL